MGQHVWNCPCLKWPNSIQDINIGLQFNEWCEMGDVIICLILVIAWVGFYCILFVLMNHMDVTFSIANDECH